MKVMKLALATGIAFSGPALAAPVQKPKVDPAYLPYEKSGILAKITNGATIHIKCMGAGSPTVILTAGMGDWSAAWRKVQPQIAKTTRVCAWDRPGYGFSSGTTQPQTLENRVADLEAALKIAHVAGPYIAVGHSLGGYESMLFKDRNRRAVLGMVLVDPSIPDQHLRLAKAAPSFVAFSDKYIGDEVATLDRCLAGMESGKLKPGLPDPDGCWTYPPDYPPELTAALDKRDTNPLRFTAARSLATHFASDAASLVNRTRNYGNMPLIVLSAGKVADLPKGTPQSVKEQVPAFHGEFVRAHNEIAALSTRGANRMIAGATHYIQYDQPQAVIDAVDEVVRASRTNLGSAKAGTPR